MALGYQKFLNREKYIFVNTPLDFLDAPSPSSSFKDEVKMSLLIMAVSSQPATRPKLAQPTASPSRPLGTSARKPGNAVQATHRGAPQKKLDFLGSFLSQILDRYQHSISHCQEAETPVRTAE